MSLPVSAPPARSWVWAPGAGAGKWEEFYTDGMMGLGWEDAGDLSRPEALEHFRGGRSWAGAPGMLRCFLEKLQPGDVVYVRKGRNEIVGRGIVSGDYRFLPNEHGYPHTRTVTWTHKGSWNWTAPSPLPQATLATADHRKAAFAELESEMGILSLTSHTPTDNTLSPYTLENALEEVFLEGAQFEQLLEVWQQKKNLILQGAPGVGKSFVARHLAYALLGQKDSARVAQVQFHQAYDYAYFIEGYQPASEGGFTLQAGVFRSFCELAAKDPTRPYVFIIDEINRGNVSAVFGELLSLIEASHRGPSHALPLAISRTLFYVPENLYLLGLMNTADRSLVRLDHALRRRFAFATLTPAFDSPHFTALLQERQISDALIAYICQTMTQLNEDISAAPLLGPGAQIGHSFFVPETDVEQGPAWFQQIIMHELLPLLETYWPGEPERLARLKARLLDNVPE